MNAKLFLPALSWLLLSCSGASEIFTHDGVAIGGYDPVAYFLRDKPVVGSDQWTYTWRGATWRFSTEHNRDLFQKDPEKYAPQFGGYCAYGVSNGYKAPTNADAWSVVDGRLYLNYNLDVREKWFREKSERITIAEKNWEDVKGATF